MSTGMSSYYDRAFPPLPVGGPNNDSRVGAAYDQSRLANPFGPAAPRDETDETNLGTNSQTPFFSVPSWPHEPTSQGSTVAGNPSSTLSCPPDHIMNEWGGQYDKILTYPLCNP
jgi:hypothetical protein